MRLITGSIHNGTPILKIELSGGLSQPPVTFDVVVDTGFTGFIYIPIRQARPLGLQALGTTPVILADGKTHTRQFANIWAVVGGQKEQGLALLETSAADILLGLDFLRVFKLGLFLTSTSFALVDEDAFAQFIAAQGSGSSGSSPPTP